MELSILIGWTTIYFMIGKTVCSCFIKLPWKLPDITWAANNGLIIYSIDREVLTAMENSNCIGFKVGLESGNPEILKSIRKPLSLNTFFRFSELMADFPSMFASTNIILGLPTETFGQMLDTLMVCLKTRLDWTNYYLYQPIKNTESFQTFGGLVDQRVTLSHGKDYNGPISNNPGQGFLVR